MRFGKIIIACFTAVLTAVAFLALPWEEDPAPKPLSLTFSLMTGEGTELLSCWENPEGGYVVFLPGYAEMDQLTAVPGEDGIMIHGQPAAQMRCGDIQLNQAYSLTWNSAEGIRESTVTFVKSANMPALYLDVSSGSMEYIHMDKTNEEPGSFRLYDKTGALQHAGEFLELKGRGDTSWTADKKPYNLTLSQEADLLGMGSAQRWILLSEGANAANIRNKIVYDFAKKLGMSYSPDCQWVDLYLNGEYAGLYLLSERNEIHPQRIHIPAQGSFLISMEDQQYLEEQKIPYVYLDSKQVLRLRHSGMEEQQIKSIWSSLKNALLSESGVDPVTGKHWQALIDVDSWVCKYLIEEVFANPDGGVVSQFFYYSAADPQGRIYAGPVWDYDFAMGGEEFWMRNYPSFLLMDRAYVQEGHYLPWFYELYHKEAFYQQLTEFFETEFLPLLTELIQKGLDSYRAAALDAMLMDGLRWGYPEQAVLNDLTFIGTFLENRMAFLKDLWVNDTPYYLVCVDPGRYGLYGYFAVKEGEVLPQLPAWEEIGGLGWYRADTEEPFDITQPIFEDVGIYVKKPETSLPVIHYLPLAALVLALPLLALWDRIRAGRREKEK